jgi:predicted nucleic acid-binding Zn ribbon protein
MFCPKCGKQIPDRSKFCPYCGAKIMAESIPEERKAVRKKNSLLIFIPIIVVVIAVGIFLYIKLSQMNDYARRERVKFDFNSIAVAITVYKTDWDVYPIAPNSEEFGKPADNPIITSAICKELTGTDATLNRPGNTTLTGEDGGIEYLKTQTLQAMYNPFNSTKGYHYATGSAGTTWILWVEIDNENSLYRTNKISDLIQCATSEIPKPNQSAEKGTKVEAIKAVDINGNAVDLSKLKNFKLFILGINPGCKACVESIQQLSTEIAKYDTSNIKFIVLSFSSEPNDAQKLLLLLPEGAIGILDTDRNLASALKVNSSPYIALVDKDLTLFYRGPGELTKETLDNIKTFLLE